MGLFKSKAERKADFEAKKAELKAENAELKAKRDQLGQDIKDKIQATPQAMHDAKAAASERFEQGIGKRLDEAKDRAVEAREARRNRD